jgi:hypothetical protein
MMYHPSWKEFLSSDSMAHGVTRAGQRGFALSHMTLLLSPMFRSRVPAKTSHSFVAWRRGSVLRVVECSDIHLKRRFGEPESSIRRAESVANHLVSAYYAPRGRCGLRGMAAVYRVWRRDRQGTGAHLRRHRALAGLFFLAALVVSPARGYETEKVILVIIDGLRYTEGLGDTSHTYVPKMWELAQQGAIIEPFLNDGYTYTSRAIPAIWCGNWTEIYQFSDPACGGQQNNYTRYPTIFEYYRKQLDRPEEDCIYVLKDVGCPWKGSFDPDYGPDYWPLYHSVGYTDQDVWREAEEILDAYAPTFLLIYLAEVDHAGHSGNWTYYTNTIAMADSIVGMLWNYLQNDEDYAGTTTMFVTNDHGRHSHDWTGHGCGCDGCRTIQLLAIGLDIESGLVSEQSRTLRDITPTIGELLGFTAEDATGTILAEILTPEVAADDARYDPKANQLRIRVVNNPTSFATRVVFRLPSPGYVGVYVHDLSGSLLATSFEGALSAGEHQVGWNGLDGEGREVGNGVYMLSLITGYGRTTHTIVRLP